MKTSARIFARRLLALTAIAHICAAVAAEISPDAKLISQLADSGSDLDKLHQIEFRLHFPSQKNAQRAEGKLLGLAFATKIVKFGVEGDWVVLASKVMYPIESDLLGLRDKLNVVATDDHGIYEGWHARVFEPKSP
jgi:hypothetical protein